MEELDKWYREKSTPLIRLGERAESKLAKLTDQFDCIVAVASEMEFERKTESGTGNTADVSLGSALVKFFSSLFSDDSREGILMTTIHSGKGLEADTVWVLRPDLLPHPAAKREHDVEQEMNLLYVGCTRFMRRMVFVGPVPKVLESRYLDLQQNLQQTLQQTTIVDQAENQTVEGTVTTCL
jgi:superfamily I DNA/RNA helicase